MSRTRSLNLTIDQLCTLRLALIGWSVRCEHEAALMEKWALEELDDAQAAKCRANAAASRQFKVEADSLLEALP